MTEALRPDLCIVGGGAAGLAVAAGAARMGAQVVLCERGRMGGECLNTGCVPSKALLAAAHAAEAARQAGRFGIVLDPPRIDFSAVRKHIQGVVAAIAPNDSVARFEGLGVRVLQQAARFVGPEEVETADGTRIAARRFVVATGSRPLLPPIAGLDRVPLLTNENVFELDELPSHLVVVGGGPVGIELAQAFRRLGAAVTVLEQAAILGRDDPELATVVKARLAAEGVALHERIRVERVGLAPGGGIGVEAKPEGGARLTLSGSHLLVAAGRRPAVEDLGLEAAGIAATPRGIVVDRGLRTGNRRVFALGDVIGGAQFTHVAAYQAGIVLRRALFRLPARVDDRAWPWVTYTDPELAQVGLAEAAARDRHGRISVLRWPFARNDRAEAERATAGLVKVVADARGRVLGAGIVGARAGELILPWCLAIGRRMGVRALASLVAPYPTLGEASQRAAGEYFAPHLFGPRVRALVRFLARFG